MENFFTCDPMQNETAEVLLADGISKEKVSLVIEEEFSDLITFYFYYKGEKITNEKQARKAGISCIIITRIITHSVPLEP